MFGGGPRAMAEVVGYGWCALALLLSITDALRLKLGGGTEGARREKEAKAAAMADAEDADSGGEG